MKIEHIAMYVEDIERARIFFERYFNATSNTMYQNEKKQFQSYFLTFETGARLELMHKKILVRNRTPIRTGFIHIAFSVGSKEAVDELTARLKQDGYEVMSKPRTTGDGYYESCVLDVEGNQIEITI